MVSGRHKVAGSRRPRSAHHADVLGSSDECASVLQGQFMCNRLQQIDECEVLPPLPLPSACHLSRLINSDWTPRTEYDIHRYRNQTLVTLVCYAFFNSKDVHGRITISTDTENQTFRTQGLMTVTTCVAFFLLLSFDVSRHCHCNWVLGRYTLEHTNIHLPGRCSIVVRVSDRHWTWLRRSVENM